MNELDLIESLIKQLREIKSAYVKREKLSEKALAASGFGSTPKKAGKANSDLNFHCMSLQKDIVSFARTFKGSFLDVETGEQDYRPSGFHNYKY